MAEQVLNENALSIPGANTADKRVLLHQRISAVKLLPQQSGRAKLGGLTQLEPGTLLYVCGDGYNERTVKVSVQTDYFFVFKQDLEPHWM